MNFEEDLKKLSHKLKENKNYAQGAYHSLCNVEWIHKSAPSDWYDLLKQEAADLERRRNVWWRSWPIAIIRFVRGFIIPIAHKKVPGTINYGGEIWATTVMKPVQPWAWLNMKLMKMEWPFYVLPGIPHNWIYSCSWRYAGGLIAEIRDQGEDYMDFYCSGQEGYVNDEFECDMAELGWIPTTNGYDYLDKK